MKMRQVIRSEYTGLLFRLVLGYVFIYASIGKISNPLDFSIAIQNYRILPDSLSNIMAIILPWLELYCGLFLVLGILPRGSSIIIASLTTVFIIAIISAMVRGLDISCGCTNPADTSDKLDFFKVVEDIFYLAISLYCYFFPPERLTVTKLIHLIKPEKLEPEI